MMLILFCVTYLFMALVVLDSVKKYVSSTTRLEKINYAITFVLSVFLLFWSVRIFIQSDLALLREQVRAEVSQQMKK